MSKLLEIQSELKAPKNQYNKFGEYNYRSAEDILEALKPILKKKGAVLTLSDEVILLGDRHYVKATATLVDSKDGTSTSTTAFAREIEDRKKMDPAQLTGTASSYARKYALNGMFLIDDTKDPDSNEKNKEVKDKEKAHDKERQAERQKVIEPEKETKKEAKPEPEKKDEGGSKASEKKEPEPAAEVKGESGDAEKPWNERLNDKMVEVGFRTAEEKTAFYDYLQIQGYEERAESVLTNWDQRLQEYKDTLGASKEEKKEEDQELDWDK